MQTLSVPDRLEKIMDLAALLKEELRITEEIAHETRRELYDHIVKLPSDLLPSKEIRKLARSADLGVDEIPYENMAFMHGILNDVHSACKAACHYMRIPRSKELCLNNMEYQEWGKWEDWQKNGSCASRIVPIDYSNMESIVRWEEGIASRPWNRSLVNSSTYNLSSVALERYYKPWFRDVVRGPTAAYAFYDKRDGIMGEELTIHRIGAHPLATGSDIIEMLDKMLEKKSDERKKFQENFSVTACVNEEDTALLLKLRSCFVSAKGNHYAHGYFDDGNDVSNALRLLLDPKKMPWGKKGS
jgi:hypothetical protein